MKKINYQMSYYNLFIFLIVGFLVSSCTKIEDLNYDTRCDKAKLLQLINKNLVIILFDYNSKLPTYGTSVDSSIADVILKIHKNKFLSSFGSLFNLQDITTDSLLNTEIQKIKFYNQQSIMKVILSNNADGSIIITNNYGYKMSSGPLIPSLIKRGLEAISSKQTKPARDFLFGPSNVGHYIFASNIYITDKQGNKVWNFHGKVSALPEPFRMFKNPKVFISDEFLNDFMGFDPSQKTIIRAIALIADQYLKYTNWLVTQDIKGSAGKSYFLDYPKEKRDKHIRVYPVSK